MKEPRNPAFGSMEVPLSAAGEDSDEHVSECGHQARVFGKFHTGAQSDVFELGDTFRRNTTKKREHVFKQTP